MRFFVFKTSTGEIVMGPMRTPLIFSTRNLAWSFLRRKKMENLWRVQCVEMSEVDG